MPDLLQIQSTVTYRLTSARIFRSECLLIAEARTIVASHEIIPVTIPVIDARPKLNIQ